MAYIEVEVTRVEFQNHEYILFKDALLEPDTIQQGKLALFVIQEGQVWRHHEVVGNASEVLVLGDDTMTIDVVDLISAMFDTLDGFLEQQSD